MIGYAARVRKDIARWAERGLIDAPTAAALSLDIGRNGAGRFSFGYALAMMAAALMAASVLVFTAANWEAMPRLARAGMLFALILAGYVGGAVLKWRGHEAFGEGAWVVAAAAFGAAIALIGQMYHLSGDERQAILVWGAGTALAAAALRSPQLSVGAVLLAGIWMVLDFSHSAAPSFLYPVFALALWALSVWTGSRPARHLQMAGLVLFVILLHGSVLADGLAVPVLLIAGAAALLALGRLRPAEAARLGLGDGLAVHALIAFLAGIGLLQFDLDHVGALVLVAVLAIAGIVAILLVEGRRNRVLRRFAYAGFAWQLCYLYVAMLGSMLGTAGFFLAAGAALALLALFIVRLERRFSDASPPEEALS